MTSEDEKGEVKVLGEVTRPGGCGNIGGGLGED